MVITDFMKDATNRLCVPFDTDVVEVSNVPAVGTVVDESSEEKIQKKRVENDGDMNTTGITGTTATGCTTTCIPTSIYYVPSYDQEDGTTDSGEAKFLLTSTCTCCYKRRNRIPRIPQGDDRTFLYQSKPSSLLHLDDLLYYSCISDLQSTLKYRSAWFFLFWLPFCMCASLSSLVLLVKHRLDDRDNKDSDNDGEDDYSYTNDPINEYKSSWQTISFIAVTSFIIGKLLYRTKLANIEEEIHIRVQYEWLPIFERYGFSINYVIDDPGVLWSRKETYIHIYRIQNFISTAATTTMTTTTDDIRKTPSTAIQQQQQHSHLQRNHHNQHRHHSPSLPFRHVALRRSNSILLLNDESTTTDTSITITSIVGKTETNQRHKQMVFDEEVKYLVFYPMELPRRNIDARQMGYNCLLSSSSTICGDSSRWGDGNRKCTYCPVGCTDVIDDDDDDLSQSYDAKPPSLRTFPDTVEAVALLRDFLYDIEMVTTPSYTIRMIMFLIVFILFIVFCVYAMARHDSNTTTVNTAANNYSDDLDGSFALFGFLFMIYVCDRFLRLYTNLYPRYYRVVKIIETTWAPQFQLYGYTVTYRVDQPHWYSFREDYIHIYKNK